MRVGLISYHTSPLASLGSSSAGGMNVYVRRLAEGLAARDIEVDVFTRRDSPETPGELEFTPGARLITVRAGPARVLPKNDLAAYAPLFAQSLACLAQRKSLTYDVIHSHYWLSAFAAQALRTSDQPWLHMFHTLRRVKQLYQPDAGSTDAPSRDYAEQHLLRSEHTMVFSTEAEIDDVEAMYGFRPRFSAIIPPGVDRDRFAPEDSGYARKVLGLGDAKIILFVGRMDRAKGVDDLLRAAALLRGDPLASNLRIVIVGGDDNRRDSVAKRELSRLHGIVGNLQLKPLVDFRGVVPQEELPLYYSACDVCVVPSRYESFGMVALEALSSGRPVIGFRSRGLQQTVHHGSTGLLVENGDTNALAQALSELLGDPRLARRMGMAARESVKAFRWEEVSERSVALYSALLAESAPALALGSW